MQIDGILTPEQEAMGLYLVEEDDHLLALRYSADGISYRQLALFSQTGGLPEMIRLNADYYLKEMLEKLNKQGITLVIVPDGDKDHR